jgi:hypothetical protein
VILHARSYTRLGELMGAGPDIDGDGTRSEGTPVRERIVEVAGRICTRVDMREESPISVSLSSYN